MSSVAWWEVGKNFICNVGSLRTENNFWNIFKYFTQHAIGTFMMCDHHPLALWAKGSVRMDHFRLTTRHEHHRAALSECSHEGGLAHLACQRQQPSAIVSRSSQGQLPPPILLTILSTVQLSIRSSSHLSLVIIVCKWYSALVQLWN